MSLASVPSSWLWMLHATMVAHFDLANTRDPFSSLDMKRIAVVCAVCLLLCSAVRAQSSADDDWDLLRVMNASTHVFYGEVLRVVPEPLFRTGVSGVHVQDLASDPLPMQELVWPEGKQFTFTVIEDFKGPVGATFESYRSDHDLNLWTYVENDAGDVFLSPPVALDPLLMNLEQTDRGLFFVRTYLGSNIPVLYRARLGQGAEDDLELLHAQQASNGVPLARIIEQRERAAALQAEQAAAAFKVFEDEYYKMLRIRELDIRSSLLQDLIVRMGFEGRWDYYEFKAGYEEQYGAYVQPGEKLEVPSDPTDALEKLWKMASEELAKIEVILKARAQKR